MTRIMTLLIYIFFALTLSVDANSSGKETSSDNFDGKWSFNAYDNKDYYEKHRGKYRGTERQEDDEHKWENSWEQTWENDYHNDRDHKDYDRWIHDGKYPTPVAPEPISSILFLTGGAILGVRCYYRKIKK